MLSMTLVVLPGMIIRALINLSLVYYNDEFFIVRFGRFAFSEHSAQFVCLFFKV
jgi:hypothetical protein